MITDERLRILVHRRFKLRRIELDLLSTAEIKVSIIPEHKKQYCSLADLHEQEREIKAIEDANKKLFFKKVKVSNLIYDIDAQIRSNIPHNVWIRCFVDGTVYAVGVESNSWPMDVFKVLIVEWSLNLRELKHRIIN